MRHPNVRNADEVEVREMIKGRHNMRLRQLGKPAGSIALGATLTEVAPGGISFPRHAHNVNEEAIYVLSGSGEARIGDARVPVRPGDWIALPTGPEHAHQMVNVSAAEPLVYLCISTMLGAEIVEYPDSGKVNARVADPTSPVGFRRIGMFRADSGTLDYWEGEPDAWMSRNYPHIPFERYADSMKSEASNLPTSSGERRTSARSKRSSRSRKKSIMAARVEHPRRPFHGARTEP